MNKYKSLLNNTIIYFVGTLGSKIISFILVPIYTYYLSTSEFGRADLITVTAMMLMPIITLCIYEAVLRFSMAHDRDEETILRNAFTLYLKVFSAYIILSPLLLFLNFSFSDIIFLSLLVLIEGTSIILSQYARGIGKSKIFAVDGILKTLTSGLFNIIFIVFGGMGLTGYLLSLILSYASSSLFLAYKVKLISALLKSTHDKKLTKLMVSYALPLVPNNIMWSLINSSSKFIINFFLGINYNGLFAVSSKIPTVISIGSQVFAQAWQLSVIQEFEDKSKSNEFYSQIFSIFSTLLFLMTAIIIAILKPLFSILFSTEYFAAWESVPFLLLGAVFSAFSAFVGTVYTASKQTSGTLKTSMVGGLVSIIFNLILIPYFGLLGAGISSFVSYSVMFLLRYYDTSKYLKLHVSWKKLIGTLTIILIQSSILFLQIEIHIELFLSAISIFTIVIINSSYIKEMLRLIVKMLKAKAKFKRDK